MSPALAQTSDFARLSPLDAAVFAKPLAARLSVNPDYAPLRPAGHMQFIPVSESYVSPNILERFREVRRYGGRLSVTFLDTGLLLEGEGARDYGPAAKKLDIGRLRLSKELKNGYSAGLEVGAYRGYPEDIHFHHEHVDRDYTVGFHVTRSW
ncbi:MAG: hypothetical protein ACM3TU_01775 [Bacillota bacterium]